MRRFPVSQADERFWARCEQLLIRDPARRGLASFRHQGEPLCRGHLRRAVESLAVGRRLAIVTGFCVVEHDPPVAETDGPPGALYLAAVARDLGYDVALVSDAYGMPLLAAGAAWLGLPDETLREFPFEAGGPEAHARASNAADSFAVTDAWVESFYAVPEPWTHLVAIERPGPSHTLDSIRRQPREGAVPEEQFAAEEPVEHRDLCHNIRGRSIHGYTAKTHRLFECAAGHSPATRTIAAIDGGNELGSGTIPWETLRAAIDRGPSGQVVCRVPTDATLVCGVSDWGGYALAVGLAAELGRAATLAERDLDAQRALIETIVRRTGAVDGVTCEAQATVDGLPLETYLQALAGLRAAVGLAP
ncbi:MAG: DUF4392 domain-containing protein [Pirellulales bacterium]|nr:DUF4392 domain-containing protein [Pirellulales bacterium]